MHRFKTYAKISIAIILIAFLIYHWPITIGRIFKYNSRDVDWGLENLSSIRVIEFLNFFSITGGLDYYRVEYFFSEPKELGKVYEFLRNMSVMRRIAPHPNRFWDGTHSYTILFETIDSNMKVIYFDSSEGTVYLSAGTYRSSNSYRVIGGTGTLDGFHSLLVELSNNNLKAEYFDDEEMCSY